MRTVQVLSKTGKSICHGLKRCVRAPIEDQGCIVAYAAWILLRYFCTGGIHSTTPDAHHYLTQWTLCLNASSGVSSFYHARCNFQIGSMSNHRCSCAHFCKYRDMIVERLNKSVRSVHRWNRDTGKSRFGLVCQILARLDAPNTAACKLRHIQ